MKKRRFSSMHLKRILIGLIAIEVVSFTVISMASYGLYTDIVRNVTLMTDSVEEKVSYNLSWISENLLQTAVTQATWRELDKKDSVDAVAALTLLKANYSTIKEQYGENFNFFIIKSNEEQYQELTGVTLPFSVYKGVRAFLREQIQQEHAPNGKWLLASIEEERYVYTYYRNGDRVVGAWIDEETFLQKMADGEYGEKGEALLVLKGEYDSRKAGKHILTRQIVYDLKPNRTDFYIEVTISGNDKLFMAVVLQYSVLFVGGSVLLFSVLLYFYIRRNVLKPMRKLSEQIESGELRDLAQVVETVELEDAYATITNLVAQMKKLKIELYEEELEKKQIELNFRKTQIKPHFFINCLSSIFYMAQDGDTEGVKRLSLLISDYFREVLTDGFEEVELAREVKHVQNYVAAQAQCNAFSICLEVDVPEAAAGAVLPALLIGTFVENCVRHGRGSGAELHIRVTAKLREESAGKVLYVAISDDAGGFDEKLLETLNTGNSPVKESQGHHLGINNALTRLALMYGGEARAVFSNAEEGARVELWIPQRAAGRREENRYEAADRG